MTLSRFALICLIYAQSIAHGVDPKIITAQVFCESSFRPGVSNHGCTGLLQVRENTWCKVLGVTHEQLLDPWQNLDAGMTILRIYYDQTGNIRSALRRYNSGYRLRDTGYADKVLRFAGYK